MTKEQLIEREKGPVFVVVHGVMTKDAALQFVDEQPVFTFGLKVALELWGIDRFNIRVEVWAAWDAFMLYMPGRRVMVTGIRLGSDEGACCPYIIAKEWKIQPIPRAIKPIDLGKKLNMLFAAREGQKKPAQEKLDKQQRF